MRLLSSPRASIRAPLPFSITALVLATVLGRAVAQEEPAAKPPERHVAYFAGQVHPVSGAAIKDGVVLVRSDRIAAVGKRSEVTIPEGTQAYSYPEGHIYPGLVDALTDAYTDQAQRNDAATDAGTPIEQVLRVRGDREDGLLPGGITTAYVGSRAAAAWRGLGAIVRPQASGFTVWEGRAAAAGQLRLTAGPGGSHALQRMSQAEGAAAAFDGLEAYEKTFTEHKKALEKYGKDFEEYLAFHRKKSGTEGKDAAPATSEGTAPAAGTGEGRRGRGGQGQGGQGRGRGGQGGERGGNPPAPAGTTTTPPATENPQAPAAESKPAEQPPAEKAPARPTFPKEPPRDPAKEALLKLKSGALPLRVEVHRQDEIRSALTLRSKHQIPQLVLEQAYGAAPLAAELAAAGVPCVLTEGAPGLLPAEYRANENFDLQTLPGVLHKQGVAVAIASGSAARARWLPLLAANAVGAGMDADAAVRAITLTPAEVLGVAKDTGSLDAGKLADLLVCDRPLLQSDCRVLRVVTAGQTGYEAR